ncbi:uncharacterized protein LOC114323165 [Camellia sinensis]|uniref:uncharacterized protein LOC114323165 n=1 Tax=Camellia sinensis TaxID=4442 RepID=UPI001035D1DF|nr:uncharacterized protein LOC114323165 [Camellia sinensis]
MIIIGDDITGISSLQQFLHRQFEMKDLGLLNYFLGLEISQDSSGYFLAQAKYTSDLLAHTGLTNYKTITIPVDPQARLTPLDSSILSDVILYRQLVGSFVYLIVTHPDISYTIHIVSQFMASRRCPHYDALIHILHYLKGTLFHGLHYSAHKKQTLVARSSTEAEYRALVETTQELMWLCWLLSDMGVSHSATTNLYCDN